MAQQQRMVQRLSDEAGSEGNQAMNEARSSIDKVARDEEAMKDGLAKHTAEYEEHVAAEVASLEARERDMIQKLNSESGSLASQIDVKQDEVKRLEVQEKQQMTESGGAGVAELTAASDLMGSAQRLTGGEIMELGERVTESLAHYEGAGEQEASGIADQIGDLLQSMPNFASMFQNDTEDAREEVEEAHQHIKVAENWTKQVIAGFEAKLDEVRSAREEQATQVHDRASEVKKMVVGEADSVVERVENIASQTEELEKDMRRQMGAFRGKLNSLAGVNVQHDAATAEDMGGKLLQLQQNHQRLMDWATTNKHRTASWRDAVEKNLHALGRSITADDAELSTMRLDQQVGLTNALRSIASGVQGDMAKAGGEEMRAYEHMTSGFGQGIADVMHKKELSAEEEADAEERADAALERKQAAQQGALSRAEAKQYELDQTVSALNRKSKEALGAMESP